MRLSEWRAVAPHRDSMSGKVVGVLTSVLEPLGAGHDPESFVVWGDDPGRYLVLAIAPAGLVTCHVRVNVPQEGPRAAGKLIRWSRLQIGELAAETQGAHRLLTVQIDQQVIRGVDGDCDIVAAFVARIFAAQDGRPEPTPAVKARERTPTVPPASPRSGRPVSSRAAGARRPA